MDHSKIIDMFETYQCPAKTAYIFECSNILCFTADNSCTKGLVTFIPKKVIEIYQHEI